MDWLMDWLIDWLTDWWTDWWIDWLIDYLTNWLTDWLTNQLTKWQTDWLTNWLTFYLTNFSTSEPQKVLRTPHVLYIFTCKCAFRHSGVHFFNIRTYKSGPNTSCFVHFHFRMCVSPQRRAFFRHLNFKKCSEALNFLAFSLRNLRFAAAACNFWCLLSAPTSAPAALTGLLFDWPDTQIIEKTQHFATSLTFGADVSSFFWLSRYCIFFLLTWLLYSAFQLSILSEVSI